MAAGRYVVFKATKGKNVFAIKCGDVEESVNLHNQAVIDCFLRLATPRRSGFVFPQSDFIGTEQGAMLISEFFSGRWLGIQKPSLHSRLSDRDLDSVFDVIVFLSGLKKSDLPTFVQDRARREFTPAYHHAKMDWFSAPALAAGLITEDELESLHTMVGEKIPRAFAHHDLVPWNMCRLKDGRLGVTDSEFARWSVAWYDLAYQYLQLFALEKNRDLAVHALSYLASRLEAQGFAHLAQDIFPALAFRVTGNLWIAAREKDKRQATRQVLARVLSGEFSRLIKS